MEALQLIKDNVRISDYSAQAINAIIEGEVNPLTAYMNLSKFMKTCENVLKDKRVKELALDALEKYGQGDHTFGDCTATVVEAGVKYDYSGCNDPEYEKIIAQEADIIERRKERETFLKFIKDYETILNEETGEVTRIYSPAKRSTTTIKLTFKK